MSAETLYDEFSDDYDRFVNWDERLAFELPLLTHTLAQHQVRRILDVACGTGQHAVALARLGYDVTATDISAAMIAKARLHATNADVELSTHVLGFGQLASCLDGPFDAILCLGNSLPHLLTEVDLAYTLNEWTTLLRPGGVVVIQMRNFDRILALQSRYMPLEEHRDPDGEWLFIRFYDFEGSQIRFHVLRLHRADGASWQIRFGETGLRAWQRDELIAQLSQAGLGQSQARAGFGGGVFEPMESPDLLLIAQRVVA